MSCIGTVSDSVSAEFFALVTVIFLVHTNIACRGVGVQGSVFSLKTLFLK